MIYFFIVTLVALVFLFYMMMEARMNCLIDLNLEIDQLPEPFENKTIFFISDIHRRRISRKWMDSFHKSPNYLVIGGDLTEKGVPFSRVKSNIELLSERGPVFFVWGNHDWSAGHDALEQLLNEYRVTILDNTTVSIEASGYYINFTGINDTTRSHDDLERALLMRRTGAPTLLFSHNPDIQSKLEKSMGLSYTICGHTHGGQINLFGYTLKEKAGVKKHPFGTLIISSGYGTTKLPLRLGAKPDALMLRLRKK